MKINSMKLLIIFGFMTTLNGIIIGLFFRAIPDGSGDVFYLVVGSVVTILTVIVNNMFRRE